MKAKTRTAAKTTGDLNKTLSNPKKWKTPIGILKTLTTMSTIELTLLRKELTSLIKRKNKYFCNEPNRYVYLILYSEFTLSMRFRIN